MFDGQLLVSAVGFNPLPRFTIIYAELAAACKALGEAVKNAGNEKVRSTDQGLLKNKKEPRTVILWTLTLTHAAE